MRGPIVTWLVLCGLAGSVEAQGVGVPSSRWGVGFGNSPEFTGLRFNYRDSHVRHVNGINLTLWQPYEDNNDAVVTGFSFGPIPGGGTLRGLQLGIFGVVAKRSAYGVNLGVLGMGAGQDLVGLNVGGLGMGAGGDVVGVNIGGLGMGAGGDVVGINVGGLGMGAGGSLIGFNLAVLGVGAGKTVRGITIAGLGAGAGEDVYGITIAGLGVGAGRRMVGLNLAGLGVGAGKELAGISFGGLGAGAPRVRGLTMSIGVVGGEKLEGVHIAVGSVHTPQNGEMKGLAVSAFNYIKGTQTGVSIGIVNYAWRVRGIQLGLVNIVRDNPNPVKVLPVFNTSF